MRRPVASLLALLVGLLPGRASAHPLDEVVQGAYLSLAPGKVLLELDLSPGPLVAAPFIQALDPNADGKVTSAEARAYAGRVLGQSTLTVNGKVVPWTLDLVESPAPDDLKVGGGVIKIYATAKRPDGAGAGTLSYQNRYRPVKSQWMANIFLLPGAGWQYGVTGQKHSNDGRQLTVTYTVTRP